MIDVRMGEIAEVIARRCGIVGGTSLPLDSTVSPWRITVK
jgi:hypothetical protein